MSARFWTPLIGAAIMSALFAPAAYASDHHHGGHCRYGDFSINIMPSCDTSSQHATGSSSDRPTVHDLDHLR